MGCNGSKPEDNLPLVIRCRQRRDLVRAAANHRYELAAAHVSYFRSLKHVGDALREFVDEELVVDSGGSSSLGLSETSSCSPSSPSLILPRNSKKKKKHLYGDEGEEKESSSLHLHSDDLSSHFDLSDSTSSSGDQGMDSDDHGNHHHHHHHDDYLRSKGLGNARTNTYSHSHDGDANGFGGNFNGYYPGNFNQAHGYSYDNRFKNPDPYTYPFPPHVVPPWHFPTNSSGNIYYLKKSNPATKTVLQEPPQESNIGYYNSYWGSPNIDTNVNYGFFPVAGGEGTNVNSQKETPPPPPPKSNASGWDFFNPFDGLDNGYLGSYHYSGYGYVSNMSSPDSTEVRKREGIPDLEEETESEVYKEVTTKKKKKGERKTPMPKYRTRVGKLSNSKPVYESGGGSSGRSKPVYISDGSSKTVPMSKSGDRVSSGSVPTHKTDTSSGSIPTWSSMEVSEKAKSFVPQKNSEGSEKSSILMHCSEESVKRSVSPVHSNGASWVDRSSDAEIPDSFGSSDDGSSPESIVLKSVNDGSVMKKGVTFEVEDISTKHEHSSSSKLSSVTLLSPNGNRNLKEVVAEIRDEFKTASGFGKEVAVMLEADKLPYRPCILKVITSRMLYLISSPLSLHDPPLSAKLASTTSKLAKAYYEDVGNDVNTKACDLSSTLDKLYAWEQKLYKEVKDEERLRVMYEKQCKRLKVLDEKGAEPTKIDAVQASIRRLLTKLDVCIKTIDAISSKIHKLRDEELEPQVTALIHGLIKMWKAMLKCHQKQFQSIMESKMKKLKAKTSLQTNFSATTELERELQAWCDRFKHWVGCQKSYVNSLNNWLLQCLHYEPEQTPDGPVPYSPGRLGAPRVFVICNDWQQALGAISEAKVSNAMDMFAKSLHHLWEKQDEEGRLKAKAEYLRSNYEKKHVRTQQRTEKGTEKMKHKPDDDDAMSDKTGLSVVRSVDSDLDSTKQRAAEERIKHKDAMKLLHDAAYSSLRGGLVPIFRALEGFTRQAVKAHEHVRL